MAIKLEDINLQRITYNIDNNELEGFLVRPESKGKFPLVVLVHGHNKLGAWENIFLGYMLQKAGFAVFMPSMIGYGFSNSGKPDFCGPKTIKGIVEGIEEVKKLDFIDAEKVGIWGISRGAIVASQISVQFPDIAKAFVFQSGAYDMKKDFEWDKKIQGIKDNMVSETEGEDFPWEKRSSINQMEKIKAPVLIVHGEDDDRIDVDQAKMLDKKLTELNKEHETFIVPNANHFILRQTRREKTLSFLKKYLVD